MSESARLREAMIDMLVTHGVMGARDTVDALITAVQAEVPWTQRAKWFRAGREAAFDGLVAHFNESMPGRYTKTVNAAAVEVGRALGAAFLAQEAHHASQTTPTQEPPERVPDVQTAQGERGDLPDEDQGRPLSPAAASGEA